MSIAASWYTNELKAVVLRRGFQPNFSVILPDWAGKWRCNLDGRQAVLELGLGDTRICKDGLCTTTAGTRIAGRVSDNGGPWVSIEQRAFAAGDPPSSRRDHILPLRYKNTDNWLLIMHTMNRNIASGYTSWNGIPFGLQCRKS
ncbi:MULTISPECIES: DUF6006 family protein [unclassified Nodularia (in: cyanobacteria)]|uniref:DUF6006 family protein n=1 Tax=unclassified Nodularia (in: cyanobacteria) TaxID=2656917 RepID=UPI0018811E4E|nr:MULTISPECIES: DUF6006 family protein [unclassified Nodularia (in: cyanobacteria)]MBE9200036.1 hypothetical protein [Nodularia sp. LEGE 06071]MCC2691939.1 hypothetical protein [Nodularia sp. LEGE 04288]